MPKTKYAFAFRGLYDDVYEVTPTFDTLRFDDCFNFFSVPPFESQSKDYRVGQILLEYLDGDTEFIFSRDIDKIEKAKKAFELCETRMLKVQKIINRIERHITRLQNHSRLIFDKVLSDGLNFRLEQKGLKTKFLTRQYEYLLALFRNCEKALDSRLREGYDLFQQICRVSFGNRLRQARIAKNISIADMASKLGLTRSGYGNYELGQRDLPTPTIYRLAKILDVSLDWLFGLK